MPLGSRDGAIASALSPEGEAHELGVVAVGQHQQATIRHLGDIANAAPELDDAVIHSGSRVHPRADEPKCQEGSVE